MSSRFRFLGRQWARSNHRRVKRPADKTGRVNKDVCLFTFRWTSGRCWPTWGRRTHTTGKGGTSRVPTIFAYYGWRANGIWLEFEGRESCRRPRPTATTRRGQWSPLMQLSFFKAHDLLWNNIALAKWNKQLTECQNGRSLTTECDRKALTCSEEVDRTAEVIAFAYEQRKSSRCMCIHT